MIEVAELSKTFRPRGSAGRDRDSIRAVDDVSFQLGEGEVLGVVGESGSGKSTLARLIMGLMTPTSGRVMWDGVDVTHLSKRRLRTLRPQVQMIFQDSLGSLNPRMTVAETLMYPVRATSRVSRAQVERDVDEALEQVGLSTSHRNRLPHQLSGGQRQRLCIARAIITRPKALIADEPVSALDLSTQAGVLNLLRQLRREMGMACIFITHDLAVAEYLCDRVVVMYAGRIVESAPAGELFRGPKHPYTQALLSSAVLGKWSDSVEETVLESDPPDPASLPKGCRFHPRCPHAEEICRETEPSLLPITNQHHVQCHVVQRAMAGRRR